MDGHLGSRLACGSIQYINNPNNLRLAGSPFCPLLPPRGNGLNSPLPSSLEKMGVSLPLRMMNVLTPHSSQLMIKNGSVVGQKDKKKGVEGRKEKRKSRTQDYQLPFPRPFPVE